MLACGRPVLIVPHDARTETVGKNVLIAWNETREAARAVGDALPMLRTADAVTVVSVSSTGDSDARGNAMAANLVRHLARHEIRAKASHLVATDADPGDLILSQAEDLGCDLIVMGGYGHSRTRELILGGVTRGVLQYMPVPVFMSH
jgi:nucleotide-binding universal stress UspA family protein